MTLTGENKVLEAKCSSAPLPATNTTLDGASLESGLPRLNTRAQITLKYFYLPGAVF
jgi:hypothetical protein